MKWTDFMKKCRDQVGVICPHCGCKDHYWKADKECYECKKCRYRQSLRSNTVMHGSFKSLVGTLFPDASQGADRESTYVGTYCNKQR